MYSIWTLGTGVQILLGACPRFLMSCVGSVQVEALRRTNPLSIENCHQMSKNINHFRINSELQEVRGPVRNRWRRQWIHNVHKLNRSLAEPHESNYWRELSYCYHGNYMGKMHCSPQEPHRFKPLLRVGILIYSLFPSKTTRILD
jgi:hypothetical protein